jgi:hypothetical protein
MKNRTALVKATAAASLVLLGLGAPAYAATATSVTVKDPHGDAKTPSGAKGSPKMDIFRITGAKAGANLRLTMTVHTLPADIADADPTGNHLVMGVAGPNSGGGWEPTADGQVRGADGGDVCEGSKTTYDTDTDTVKMVLPLTCVGGGTSAQTISGFTFRGTQQVDKTAFSEPFSTK